MIRKRILSVDWDYFFDYDREGVKESLLPDSRMEECPPEVLCRVWGDAYLRAKGGVSLSDLNPNSRLICRYKACLPQCSHVVTGVYHHEILTALQMLSPPNGAEAAYEIWHIDHHHDCYSHEPGRLTCGNWGDRLFRQGAVREFHWICNPDSNREGLPSWVTIEEMPDFSEQTFDLLFFCQSPIYTPPHADDIFCSLAGAFGYARDNCAIESRAKMLFCEQMLSGDCFVDFMAGNLNLQFVPPVFSQPEFDYETYAARMRHDFSLLRQTLSYEESLRALAEKIFQTHSTKAEC